MTSNYNFPFFINFNLNLTMSVHLYVIAVKFDERDQILTLFINIHPLRTHLK